MMTFYEFFAGAGMARAGLGADWICVMANDIDQRQGAAYAVNWGNGALWSTTLPA
jgi:DNA (cytosine-5)-methyltransferase 1